ncbi:ACP S-malonyltransferase [Streptococcus sp. sy004]|uniref:ACP S-malonyltransferase n=1 Tax=Streptococcus sp. sy004 TaxID=2600149 RepID=UPI0011B73CA6|nr:ACP S-malonyltransferase [Streptococcus sp. sy004]TWT12447.1 ACP S-malonyltransferase [Streptococcus sp. sy004]
MGKTAFLFAGQGAQKLGMAYDLFQKYACVQETFAQANDILGYDLRFLIDREEDKLHQTRYTQPAIFTTSVAIFRLLQEKGLSTDMVAGLSLGEYSALVASGSLAFEEALPLVAKRGQLMETAAPKGTGKMVAVLNTPVDAIEEACRQASVKGVVSPANYNTPNQIVIGGQIGAVNEAVELLKNEGVKRLIPLNVSGPFHTALLEPASQELAKILETVSFSDFAIPLIGNTEAKVMEQSQIKSLLTRQIMEPVRFYESIEQMRAMGATRFIEIGPGQILSGFIKKIDKQLMSAHVEDESSLMDLLAKMEI